MLPIAIGTVLGIAIATGVVIVMLEAEKFEMGLAEYP